MRTEHIDYRDGETLLKGFYAYDEQLATKGKMPAVLVCHDWSGQNDFAREKAKKLAELGYVGFALDMYGEGKSGKTDEEKKTLMSPLMGNRKFLRQRIQAAFQEVKKLPMVDSSKIVAIGFCFGGLCVLDLARSGAELVAVVSFHGLLNPPQDLPSEKIKAKVLVLHGYDDPMTSPEQVNDFAKEMTAAKVDWQIHIYGHTTHAFTNPLANDPASGLIYKAQADQRSWDELKVFLKELFA